MLGGSRIVDFPRDESHLEFSGRLVFGDSNFGNVGQVVAVDKIFVLIGAVAESISKQADTFVATSGYKIFNSDIATLAKRVVESTTGKTMIGDERSTAKAGVEEKLIF